MSSYGDKVAYGKAPIAFNPKCIDDPQVLSEYLNQLAEAIYVMGGPYVPTSDQAATIPPTHPARNRVRFKLTEAIGATTTKEAAAVAVDGDGTDIAGAPAFNVVDSLNRYPAAGSGKHGWAEYIQYPDDTYRFEIVSLGGEGTVVGSGDDELVKVSSNDAAAGYLIDQIDTWSGAPAYNSSTHQPVWCDEQNDGASETVRFYTSKQSAVETYTVKVSGTDTTESYLQAAISSGSQDTAAFNSTNHQRVYSRIDNAGSNETVSLYTKRSEETGKVKTSSADTLDYLYDQFQDKAAYNAATHQLVRCDTTGAPRSEIRLFTDTTTTLCIHGYTNEAITGRSGAQWGGGMVATYTTVNGEEELNANPLVYCYNKSTVVIPQGKSVIAAPVREGLTIIYVIIYVDCDSDEDG